MRPKAVCLYPLEKFQLAGVTRSFIVLREGKWDIPCYLGDGAMVNMHLAYLVVQTTSGTSYTVNKVFPFVQESLVVFGFPDILLKPEDVFVQLIAR